MTNRPKHINLYKGRQYHNARHYSKLVYTVISTTTGVQRADIFKKGKSEERTEARLMYCYLMSQKGWQPGLITEFMDRSRTAYYKMHYKAISLKNANKDFKRKLEQAKKALQHLEVERPTPPYNPEVNY